MVGVVCWDRGGDVCVGGWGCVLETVGELGICGVCV